MTPREDTVQVPLPDYVRQIACEVGKAAARTVIAEHIQHCNPQDRAARIAVLERFRWKWVGIIAGVSLCVSFVITILAMYLEFRK